MVNCFSTKKSVGLVVVIDRLKRFFALREEIALFMAIKDNDVPELGDPTFIANLAFLTDHLSISKSVITAMYGCVKSFKCKLPL